MATVSVFNVGQTSLNWQIDGLGSPWDTDGYTNAYIVIDNGWGTSAPVWPPPPVGTSISTGVGSVSGLSPDTPYNVSAYVVAANSSTYPAGNTSFRTQPVPQPPGPVTGLTVMSINLNSLGIRWNPATGATGYHIYVNDSYYSSTYSTEYTVTGLTEFTTYKLGVSPYNDVGSGVGSSVWEKTRDTTATRPSGFSWSSIVVKGEPFDLRASDWNNLTSKINGFRYYRGVGYGNLSYTTAVINNTLTADMFNQCVNRINELSPPVSPPSTVLPDAQATVDRLNGLVNSLYSIP